MRFNRIVKGRLVIFLVLGVLLFSYGCGGGGGGSDSNHNSGGTLNITVSPESLSIKTEEEAMVTAKATCSSKDLFASSCSITSATVKVGEKKHEIPLGYTLKVGESKSFNIKVLPDGYMAIEPFSYLHNNNPSTSTSGWSQYSEVIATTDSKFVAFGDEVCVQNLTVSPQSQQAARGSVATFTIFGGKPPYKVTSSNNWLQPNPSTVTSSGGTFSVTVPINITVSSATFTITDADNKVVTATLSILPPDALAVYPAEIKVSGATGGTIKFDVMGGIPQYRVYTNNNSYPPDPETLFLAGSFRVTVPANSQGATVIYTVVDSTGKDAKATLIIDVPSGKSLKAANSQTCTPVNNFSFNLSDYTPGTMKIVAGNQVLEEKAVGVLSGDGSGTITKTNAGYTVSFSFTKAPSKGIPINAYYLTKVKALTNNVRDESLKIIYGNLTLVQVSNYLVDGSGKVYGQISGRTITITVPLGMKESQMIASYQGDPYNANGGVVIGKGDGKTTVFSLKTQYFPLQEGSLKVFTSNQPGKNTSVNWLTGEFVVSFDTAPALDEEIKVSYVLAKVSTVVNLAIDGFKFDIGLEVKK